MLLGMVLYMMTSPAIDFNMELPWFRLLFFFLMLCTGASASVNGLSRVEIPTNGIAS